MNPFEVARQKANEARLVLAGKGVGDSTKGFELVTQACKVWSFAILYLPNGHPLLSGADAVIRIKQGRIVVRKDLDGPLKAFLLAHELGHFFLHQGGNATFAVDATMLTPDVDGGSAVQYVESYGPRERQELQANVFAREFLLPRILAKELLLAGNRFASAIVSDLELPMELVRLQLLDALLLPNLSSVSIPPVPQVPTPDQEPAVNSPHRYTLVEAGPGTGKTTTLLLRVRRLLESGAVPTGIVILTFSNKAAGELVTRLKNSGIQGAERMWVGTFHSFGLEFLRKFGSLCGLSSQIKLMDRLGGLNILEEALPDLSLGHFDTLSDPMQWLPDILDAISRCKDDLVDADSYRSEVLGHPSQDAVLQAKRVDAAILFKAYEDQFRARQAVDFNDLLGHTGQVLNQGDSSVEEYLHAIHHVLVDEYQDVNRASAQLVKSLAKYAQTVWAVGDANQAIYAFMGASSRNLTDFGTDFPGAERIPLGANHRSYQEITDSFYRLSTSNPSGNAAKQLNAEKGLSGHVPVLVECHDNVDEQDALAQRVTDLTGEVPFGQQAVLVHSNDMAVKVARGLERHGIPVLYLGNVYERPDVKELVRLLHLSVDRSGASVGSDWTSPELKISHDDLLPFQSRAKEFPELPWWEQDTAVLSPHGQTVLQRLDEMTAPLRSMVSPWDALCHLLLESGWLIHRMCADSTQAAINARLSMWQFIHSCRTPDGLVQFPTIRNFQDRIRLQIRLGLEKNLRNVPPEAEGLNAVRILTAHKSKGLEFDAVHLLETKRETFEPNAKGRWPLIPEHLLDQLTGVPELAASRRELHNLLYVAMSRARKYLTVYKRSGEDLPTAMDGICKPIAVARLSSNVPEADSNAGELRLDEISLDDLVTYKNGCPRRVEFSRRVGRVSGGALPVYRLVEIAQRRVLQSLTAGPESRTFESIATVVETELRRVDLWDHRSRLQMTSRLSTVAQTASNLYSQGGVYDQSSLLRIGNLKVGIEASQVLNVGGAQVLRLFRKSKTQIDRSKQTLGVLLKTHEKITGQKLRVVSIALMDGSEYLPVSPRSPTIDAYEIASRRLNLGHFEARPTLYTCPLCPYYMQCDQGQR